MSEGIGAYHAQPVVCVRQSHAGAQAGDEGSEAQHRALDGADLCMRAVAEARSEDESEVLLARPINHRRRIRRIVLAIGIESDDVAGPTRERRFESGLQGSALTEVERVGGRVGAGRAGQGRSVIR